MTSFPWRCAALPSRAVLAVSGADAIGLLTSVSTNSLANLTIENSSSSSGGAAVYAAFLSSRGRVLHDALLLARLPAERRPLVLLDCAGERVSSLEALLRRYILRSDVAVSDVSPLYSVWAAWNPHTTEICPNSPPPPIVPPESDDVVAPPITSPDPRNPALGWRLLLPRPTIPCWPAELHATENDYTRHRVRLGVAEGTDFPLDSAMPLEWNLDYLNAIDFNKGCFVGQELLARTHHTGVVRKRIVPVRIEFSPSMDADAVTGLIMSTIVNPAANNGDIGRLYTVCCGNTIASINSCSKSENDNSRAIYGLAMIRMANIVSEGASASASAITRFAIKGHENISVLASIPSWWPQISRSSVDV